MIHQFKMKLQKETKGALRYVGLGEDDPSYPFYLVGTLYLRKAGLFHRVEGATPPPDEITVTIEV